MQPNAYKKDGDCDWNDLTADVSDRFGSGADEYDALVDRQVRLDQRAHA
jgi:hypothetical protein